MDADWYEDPLGRFDGRFFDGERWTDEVSDGGVLRVDDEFAVEAGEDSNPFAGADMVPAVEQISTRSTGHTLSTSSAESPVRVVAVLDESIVSARPTTALPVPDKPSSRWRWLLAALVIAAAAIALALFASRGDDGPAGEPAALDQDQEARVQDLVEGGSPDDLDPADMQELDSAPSPADQGDAAQGDTDQGGTAQGEDGGDQGGVDQGGVDQGDAAQGGGESSSSAASDGDGPEVDRPQGAVDPETSFNDQEAVELGTLRIANGSSLLLSLTPWHRGFALERGVELGADAQCWLAERGGAGDLNAYCGPVGTDGDNALYDVVPLSFDDSPGGQVAQPVLDAVQIDQLLPTGIVLIDGR